MKLLIRFLFTIFICSVAFVAYLKAHHNWDMLGYMACSLSIDQHSIDSVHAITYRHAKLELPAKDYQALTDPTNSYRKRNFEDAGYFHEQLPLYNIKPLYVLLIYVFYKAGVPLTAATVLPSVLSYIFIGWLLFFWIARFISLERTFIFCVLIMLSPPFWEVALSSSPDALAGLLAFSAFFLIIEGKKITMGLSLLVLCIAVRIDFVLLTMMIIGLLRYSKTGEKNITTIAFLLFSLISVILFSVIAFGPGYFSSDTIAYYTIVQSDFVKQFGTHPLLQYFILLFKGAYSSRYSMISLFLLLAIMLLYIRRISLPARIDFETQIIVVVLLNIFLRYLLHPTIEDRFLIAHYLVVSVIFIKTFFGKNLPVPAFSK